MKTENWSFVTVKSAGTDKEIKFNMDVQFRYFDSYSYR